jgi:isopenicillin N synthase-like dioxygenase
MEIIQDDVPVAELETIDLRLLLLGDPTEQQRLHRVCVSTGFAYLDLSKHGTFESDWRGLLDFSLEYFALPNDEKSRDARGSDVYGWVMHNTFGSSNVAAC